MQFGFHLKDVRQQKILLEILSHGRIDEIYMGELTLTFKYIDEEELLNYLDVKLPDIKELSPKQFKEMHLRYGTISSCLLKVDDETERRLAIKRASNEYKTSEQTIRHRLCDYLVFQNIVALAPHLKKEKELSNDEKHFRWALNKYFYDSRKLSLRQAYKFLLRDKYTDSNGKLVQNSPKR